MSDSENLSLSDDTAGGAVTMRIVATPTASLLSDLSRVVGAAGARVIAVDFIETSPQGAVVDVTFRALDTDHIVRVEKEITSAGYLVRRTSDRTFLSHLGGTISVEPRTQIRTRDDLSLIYTPGVGKISEVIAREPRAARNLTIKGNSVAIVTNGSAVLGLGRIGPLAALPVMEGKAALFKTFGQIDAFPICLDAEDPDKIVEVTKALSVGFGGINLEDIAAPECFEVEARLQAELDIPVFHDDQHGTAVVVLAGLINACRITGRALEDLRVVVVGIGAAGHAISTALLDAGVRELIPVDIQGPLRTDSAQLAHHLELATRAHVSATSLEEALTGADAVIGVARRGSIPPAMLRKMAPRPLIFGLSNPDPEFFPNEVPDDAILATGRSDLPNQINNALCFPGIFRGALDARATRITPAMRQAAAEALANAVSEDQRAIGLVVPSVFNVAAHRGVAEAVRRAASDIN
jgi:malate dehydrogenase (oxaloacetate-decarboxylating)